MNKGVKIVTIGGGSSYTPELIEGFIKRNKRIQIDELWLVDVEDGLEKLNVIYQLTKRMFEHAGMKTKVYQTLDRRQALIDADFVTTQFRVGQLQARANDEKIPNSHGILGQETNGVGGIFKAFRTIPQILEIVKDVQELCPDAFIINFTNPAGIVSEAVNRYTTFKRFIGVCNVPIHMKFDLSKSMNINCDDLEIDFLGLNHMVFGLDVRQNGTSIMKKAIDSSIEANATMNNITDIAFNKRLIKELNLLLCPYHRYYFKYNEMIEEQLSKYVKGETRAEQVIEYEKSLFEKYQDVNLKSKPEELAMRGGAYYSDVACDVITSIHNNEGLVHVVNIKNNGHVENIEVDDTIEISCKITRDGAIPVNTIKRIPRSVKGIYELFKSYEIAVCEAAVTQDYDKALLALNLSPFTRSDDLNEKILDEMLCEKINSKYLKGFEKK